MFKLGSVRRIAQGGAKKNQPNASLPKMLEPPSASKFGQRIVKQVLVGGDEYRRLRKEGWKPGKIVRYIESVDQFICYMEKPK